MLHFTDRPMARVCGVVIGLLQNVQLVKGVSEDCYVLMYILILLMLMYVLLTITYKSRKIMTVCMWGGEDTALCILYVHRFMHVHV